MAYSNGEDIDVRTLRFQEREDSEHYSPYADYRNTALTERKIKQYKQIVLPLWAVWLTVILMSVILITQIYLINSQSWIVNTLTKVYSLVSYQTGLLEQKKEDKK